MRELVKTSRESEAMELVDAETPEPVPNEALIEADYAGFCGSGAGIYKFKSALEWMEMPIIIGHEYTDCVVERGEEASRSSIGERVVERSIHGCGECFQCQTGRESICQDAILTSIDLGGAYADYVAVSRPALQPAPSNVEPKHATLVEPTAVCTRVVIRNSRVEAGDRAFVAGPDPIGLLCAQVAASQGAEVVVTGVSRDTNYWLPLAEEFGYPAVNVEEDDLSATQRELTGGVGFDVVFDITGHPSGLSMAVEQVRKGGQIVPVDQTGETTTEFMPFVRVEVDLRCIYDATFEDFERASRLIGSSDVDYATFLDNRYRFTESEDVFGAFLAGETCKPVLGIPALRE